MINIRNISILILIFFTTNYNHVESAKILSVFTSQSKSHLIIYFAIVRSLVEKGHNVTVVTTIPYNEPNLNGFRHLVLTSEHKYEDGVKEIVKANGTLIKIQKTFSAIKTLIDVSYNVTLTDEFQKLMQDEKFDLIILGYIFNEFHLGLAAHFHCPIIVVWVQKPFNTLDRLVGNPLFALDYSRLTQIPIGIELGNGFLYRLINFLYASFELFYLPIYDYTQKIYYESLFPPNKYPSFETMQQNVSLVLCNNHFSEGFIRAVVPAFIEIGGIQIKSKPDSLPDDIKNFLNNSTKHGAILFSLGSNVKIEHVNPDCIKNIYAVLSNLKQNVIWKCDNEMQPLSLHGNAKNILFKNWLPQDDILAHENLKIFITHGGKGSLVEAAYHGIPMIGIPVFGDQSGNINEMIGKGFGVGVDIETLTLESFRTAIDEILTNQTYSDNVKKISKIYRDRPMSAKDTTIFWIDYVLRHNGTGHMKSHAVLMNKIQILGLDVIGFLIIIIYIVFRLVKFLFKTMWHKCCGRNSEKIDNKKSTKSKRE